jgi:hypothetical protein
MQYQRKDSTRDLGGAGSGAGDDHTSGAGRHSGACDRALQRFPEARVDMHGLARRLERHDDKLFFESFFASWNELIDALLDDFGPEGEAARPGAAMSLLSGQTRATKG